MVHAAALLRPGYGLGAEPLLLHARHRHPILGLKLAVVRRLGHVHTLRWWVLYFRFEAAAPDRLSIIGGSAGGLFVGRAFTARPELFAAAVVSVGNTDLVRSGTGRVLGIFGAWIGSASGPDMCAHAVRVVARPRAS